MSRIPRFRTRRPLQAVAIFCLGWLAAISSRGAWAQMPTAAPLSARGVDLVAVAQGPTYLGSLLPNSSAETVHIAVRYAWLADTDPNEAADQLQSVQQMRAARVETLQRRIQSWKQQRADRSELITFLNDELERLEKQTATPEELPEFVAIRIPKSRVRRTFVQTSERKLIAVHAWAHRLSDVETRAVSDLLNELKDIPGFDLQQPVSLADRITLPIESDDAWAARQAICEYDLLQPLDFQGTSGLLVQTNGPGAAEQPNAQALELLGELLQQNQDAAALESLLGGARPPKSDAENRGQRGLQKARTTAEHAGIRGFRVTEVEQDVTQRRVHVRSSFHARMSNGAWAVVWQRQISANADEARAAEEGRIRQDPRVQQIEGLVKALGVANDTLATAIRFGAATQSAQQRVDSEFYKFRDRYTRHLDGPPLP